MKTCARVLHMLCFKAGGGGGGEGLYMMLDLLQLGNEVGSVMLQVLMHFVRNSQCAVKSENAILAQKWSLYNCASLKGNLKPKFKTFSYV